MLARLTLSLRCTGKQIFDIIMWVSTDDNNSSVHIKKIPYSIIELCLAGLDTILQPTIFRIFLNEDFIIRLLPSFTAFGLENLQYCVLRPKKTLK